MGGPVSVRLDDDVRATLEQAARDRGVGLSTFLRDVAADEARRIRRARIRAQSKAVADHVARNPEAQAFFRDWGTPSPLGDE